MEKLGEANLGSEDAITSSAKKIFIEIDTDGNAKIDQDEMKAAMAKFGVMLTKKEVEKMMTEADEDGCAPTCTTPHCLPCQHSSRPLCTLASP